MMRIKSWAGSMNRELSRNGFSGDDAIRHPQIVHNSSIISGFEVTPNGTSHLRGHIGSIEDIFYADGDAEKLTGSPLDYLLLHRGGLPPGRLSIKKDPGMKARIQALDLFEAIVD